MNRLIAYALLGFGIASSVVACGDDDSTTPDDNGGAGNGGSSAGKNNGGNAGKAPTAGTAGKATGGTGGGAGEGSAGEPAGGTDSVGGMPAGGAGGDDGGGGEAVGGNGAGGEGGAPPVEPTTAASAYWLNKLCDSQAAETLACEYSPTWGECFNEYDPYLSVDGSGGICPLEEDMENFPLTVGLTLDLDEAAAACGVTSTEDWSCDLTGTPSPRVQACRTAWDKVKESREACLGF
jgi:hypothetical protein